ncbi:MAG: DEAD/DEAH box helicase [Bacillota bacterium]
MQFGGLTLDRYQVEAIAGLRTSDVLVVAPTGTGKTLVADWAAEQALNRQERVIYTAPIKSLVNQKYSDFAARHGEDVVGLLTGDLVINHGARLTFMTTEILRNMLLAGEPMTHVGLVVFDEIHFIDDPERGMVWEECLILLPHQVKILGLSATVPNGREVVDWLRWLGRDVKLVVEIERAVDLELLSATAPPIKKRPRYRVQTRGGRDDHDQEPAVVFDVDDVVRLPDHYLPVLVFAFSRRSVEEYAREHATRKRYLPPGDLEGFGPELSRDLTRCLERGIGFHHAGLTPYEKVMVENLLVRGLLKVVYCTETFAVGVNYPVRTVLISQGEKYDGRRVRPLKVREVQQMSGRAGRRGIDNKGTAFLYTISVDPYLERPPEPLQSQFNYRPDTILWHNGDEARLLQLLEKSFLYFQKHDADVAALGHIQQQEAALPPPVECKKLKFGCPAQQQYAEKNLKNLQGRRQALKGLLLAAGSSPPARTSVELMWLDKEIAALEALQESPAGARCSRRVINDCRRRLRQAYEARSSLLQDRLSLPTTLMREQLAATIAGLRELGYLDESGVTGKGECARLIHVQTVLLTELYYSGALHGLSPHHLASLAAAVDAEVREAGWLHAPWPKKLRAALNRLRSDPRVGAVVSETVAAVVFDWLKGATLSMASRRVMDPGDLYGYIRRGIDVLQQMAQAFSADGVFVGRVRRAIAMLETEETAPVLAGLGTLDELHASEDLRAVQQLKEGE